MRESDGAGRVRIARRIEWTAGQALAVVLGAVTSAIHLSVGATTGDAEFFVLGVGLLAGAVFFFTRLWNPVLYLVGAIYVGVLVAVWILAGTPRFLLGVVDAVVQIALIGTFLYLFVANGIDSLERP